MSRMEKFEISLLSKGEEGLSLEELRPFLAEVLKRSAPGDALLLPPDLTRLHSGAGMLARELYDGILANTPDATVRVMPAIGTHEPLTREEQQSFFGEAIPADAYLRHDWRAGVASVGEVPAAFVKEVSGGLADEAIPVEVNRELLNPRYSAIFSIGQVVPHEVVGLANYTKNILVGVGGSGMINSSHMLGAMVGLDKIMGQMDTPVRAVFDYAQKHFLDALPIVYILTVTTATEAGVAIHGIFAGNTRAPYESACALAREKNMTKVEKPIQKCVVYLAPEEFKSVWVGNKSVYRTRLAMAEGGELLVLAPGVRTFGEDPQNDRVIRRFGYCGREEVIRLFRQEQELRENQGAAAHLIHGSSDGKFTVTYAARLLTREEIEGVGYRCIDYEEATARYDPRTLVQGWNRMPDGEEIYFISNPAIGLWSCQD